ncbi:ATP-dependent helicase [Salirhabdus sp. Marseille-P4669]|uniref:ATP-dependent helicase n=1 Tax=Salirhabdus sp. Marseille-P4669 TaxID=2042310 RepID=UPI000C7C8ABE|nr:ATP-dependent helicase [Salirhabdus sp. Marseille-P4669]
MQTGKSFFKRKKQEIGVSLNTIQKKAVLHTEGPLLLLASPGSGKTTTIIMRIGYLIEVKGVEPARIKAVTFSNASANDMKERFQRFFPELPSVDFSTIHSLAFEVVRKYFRRKGVSYQIIEGDNPSGINKKILLRNLYKSLNQEPITDDQLDELTTYISFVKNKLIPDNKWGTVKCEVPKALEILQEYEKYKKHGTSNLLVDYDDMLTIAYHALQGDEDILASYQSRYDYVLTDESQDTSLVQHYIVKKLVEKHQNLCVVADDDQSIYGWRAAEPQYLMDFKNAYPTAQVLKMEQNYRSSSDIVNAANQFIKQNKNRYDKNMFTKNVSHKPIEIKMLADYQYQANYLVEKIQRLERYKEVAILFRNHSSSILLVDAFDRAKIPFYIKDSNNRFFSHWIVQDILNFMRLAFDNTRVDIFERVYAKFDLYLTKHQVGKLRNGPRELSVFDHLMEMDELKDWQLTKIKKIKDIYRKMTLRTPRHVIRTIRDDFGYEKVLKKMCKELGFKMETFLETLYSLEQIGESTNNLIEFANRIKHLDALMKASRFNKGENAVTLSTLHSSKGLEFDTVFMVDLVQGVIPAKEAQDQEEEVRLFYVGMTRARYHLELLAYREKYGKAVKPSMFVLNVQNILHPNEDVLHKPETFKVKKRKAPVNPNAIKDEAVIKVGLKIEHRAFGQGIITNLDEDQMEIQFSKETKQLSVSACLERGLIEAV